MKSLNSRKYVIYLKSFYFFVFYFLSIENYSISYLQLLVCKAVDNTVDHWCFLTDVGFYSLMFIKMLKCFD